MIRLPTTVEACADPRGGTFRAGGTDVMERRRSGISTGPITDLRDVPELNLIDVDTPGATSRTAAIGARVRIGTIAAHADLRAGWPGLTRAAGALATPEIRAVGTLGGNLAQHTRCWYYRHPDFACLKKGGGTCYAHDGDNAGHAIFATSPCVSVHASTLACALLAYDAIIETYCGGSTQPWALRTIDELLGDGGNPTRHNALGPGELITRVHLPASIPGERAAYQRATSRARAEWPLVEVVVRQTSAGARIAVGAVAAVPLRLRAVEAALDAGEPMETAARHATDGATSLSGNAYKLTLLPALLRSAWELL